MGTSMKSVWVNKSGDGLKTCGSNSTSNMKSICL